MPSSLKLMPKDPNNLGRGKGIYYRRSSQYKGKEFPEGYFSFYSIARDMKIKARGFNIDKVGLPKSSKIKHAGDGRLPR